MDGWRTQRMDKDMEEQLVRDWEMDESIDSSMNDG